MTTVAQSSEQAADDQPSHGRATMIGFASIGFWQAPQFSMYEGYGSSDDLWTFASSVA